MDYCFDGDPDSTAMRIGGRLYRIPKREASAGASAELEPVGSHLKVSRDKGDFSVSVEMEPQLFGKLIGKKAAHRRSFERAHGCRLAVPRRGSASRLVTVRAGSEADARRAAASLLAWRRRHGHAVHRLHEVHEVHEVRPDCFIAIKVHSESPLFQELTRVAGQLEERANADLSRCKEAPVKYHITLGVMLMNDQLEHITNALQSLDGQLPRINVPIEGLGAFGDAVIFADIQQRKPLTEIRDSVSRALNKHGVSFIEDHSAWSPHITLFKRKGSRGKQLRASFAEPFKNSKFGLLDVAEIQLLSMQSKDPDGYYKRLFTIKTKL